MKFREINDCCLVFVFPLCLRVCTYVLTFSCCVLIVFILNLHDLDLCSFLCMYVCKIIFLLVDFALISIIYHPCAHRIKFERDKRIFANDRSQRLSFCLSGGVRYKLSSKGTEMVRFSRDTSIERRINRTSTPVSSVAFVSLRTSLKLSDSFRHVHLRHSPSLLVCDQLHSR